MTRNPVSRTRWLRGVERGHAAKPRGAQASAARPLPLDVPKLEASDRGRERDGRCGVDGNTKLEHPTSRRRTDVSWPRCWRWSSSTTPNRARSGSPSRDAADWPVAIRPRAMDRAHSRCTSSAGNGCNRGSSDCGSGATPCPPRTSCRTSGLHAPPFCRLQVTPGTHDSEAWPEPRRSEQAGSACHRRHRYGRHPTART